MTAQISYAKMIPCITVLSADSNTKGEVPMDQPKFTILYCRLSNEDHWTARATASQTRKPSSPDTHRSVVSRISAS